MGLEDLRKKQNEKESNDYDEYQEFLRFKEMKRQEQLKADSEKSYVESNENESEAFKNQQSTDNELYVEFAQATLVPWIKGSIRVVRNQRMIQTHLRNTIFGLFPAGENAQSIRMTNISAVRLNQKYNGGAILLAIGHFMWMLIAIFAPKPSGWMALIAFLLGVCWLLNCVRTCLEIQRVSDPINAFYIFVPFYEKNAMLIAKDFIEDTLTRTEERGDIERAANILVDGLRQR